MTCVRFFALVLAALVTTTTPAFAHADPGTHTHGLTAGLTHPLQGIDHLLAMVAVGLLAAQIGGRALWLIPGAFLVGMIGGGTAGLSGTAFEMVELAIATSLVVLGVAITLNRKMMFAIPALAVAVFGAVHGHAHGTEVPAAASSSAYVAGFLMATIALSGGGVLLGRWLLSRHYGSLGLRGAGAAVATAGVVFALNISL